jgi:membrane-bound serine protease (ClpP class)
MTGTLYVIITLIVVVAIFELVEHVVLPPLFALTNRKSPPSTGAEGLLSKVAEVKQWDATEGRVFVDGALWRAVSEFALVKGDRAVVRSAEGLTLRVEPALGDAVTRLPTVAIRIDR